MIWSISYGLSISNGPYDLGNMIWPISYVEYHMGHIMWGSINPIWTHIFSFSWIVPAKKERKTIELELNHMNIPVWYRRIKIQNWIDETDADQRSLTKSKKYLAWILLTKHSTVNNCWEPSSIWTGSISDKLSFKIVLKVWGSDFNSDAHWLDDASKRVIPFAFLVFNLIFWLTLSFQKSAGYQLLEEGYKQFD